MRAKVLASRSCWVMAIIGAVVLTAEGKEPSSTANGKQAAKAAPAAAKADPAKQAPDGRELFAREWLPNDARAHGGDGLGPVFNDSSCVACHNQGGLGGGGAASKNVDIISAFPLPQAQAAISPPNTLPEALFNSLFGALAPPQANQPQAKGTAKVATDDQKKEAKKREKEALAKIHPAFASTRSVVLHHFGTDPNYQQWRSQIATGQFQQQVLNPAPFSGVGPVTTEVVADTPVQVAATGTLTPNSNQPQIDPATGIATDVQASVGSAPEAQPKPTEEIASSAKPADAHPAGAPPAVEAVQSVNGTITFTAGLGGPVGANGGIAFNGNGTLVLNGLANIPEASTLMNEVRMNRGNLLGFTSQVGNIQISRSQRNATALFGAGKIDAIPEKAITDLAKLEADKYPQMAGRPSKQKDGKIGRFGWKAQKPSLEDFALTACAVELGLEVPGHEQAAVALKPDYKAPGFDMNKAECDALVGFLKNLPAPGERKPANAQEATVIAAGHKQFEAVGCANCHVQKVGNADGIYSDLLLHDMGPDLGDTGNYGIFIHDMPEEDQPELPPQIINGDQAGGQPQATMTAAQLAKVTGALRQEWRTPPLWGVRDSGPYLHDGRADTLEQAIAFHGGQATAATAAFFKLKPEERQQLIAFLKSLTAPEADAKVALK